MPIEFKKQDTYAINFIYIDYKICRWGTLDGDKPWEIYNPLKIYKVKLSPRTMCDDVIFCMNPSLYI